jgi:hydrogenase maturation protease
MNSSERILVAGVGNIFLGDDAFGSEVARRLMQQQTLPSEVKVNDYGTCSYDLAYAMMDGYEATILVDATSQGQSPGTVYLIEPDLNELDKLDSAVADGHSMNPVSALQMVRSLGCRPRRLYLVGCEPAALDSEDGVLGLSECVEAAVPRAIEMIESLISDLLSENPRPKNVNSS